MKPLLVILALIVSACAVWAAPDLGAPALMLAAALSVVVLLSLNRAGEDRGFLQQIFIAGLLVRVGVATLIYGMSLQEFFGVDAMEYDYLGNELMKIWTGESLRPAQSVTRQVNGFGMLYMVSGLYTVMGRNPLAVQFLNATLGAATTIFIYLCALHIFENKRVARISAFLVAFFPSMIIWSSQGLKDGTIIFLLSVSIYMALKLGQKMRPSYLFGLSIALGCLLAFRFYIFYMVAMAIAGGFLIGMRKWSGRAIAQQLIILFALSGALMYLGVLKKAQQQFAIYGNLEKLQVSRQYMAESAQSGFGHDIDVSTAEGALTAIPLGLVYLLFAPFPWQVGSLRQSITLPEMIVWWSLFPLLIVGVWFTLKHRLRPALPVLIFTLMLTLAYSVFQGNVGTAYRQRSQLLVFYFIFVSVGITLLKERREDDRRARKVLLEEALELRRGWRGSDARGFALANSAGRDTLHDTGQPGYFIPTREVDGFVGKS